jgi:hypothetical protein
VDRPVVGWRAVPGTPPPLPDSAWDVRVLGGDAGLYPSRVLAYEVGDLEPRDFLRQLDYYLHVPGAPAQAVPEAMAVGCIPVLPPALRDTYGDAALDALPAGTVDLPAQRARGWVYVEAHHDHATYADRICSLLHAALPAQRS